MIGFTEENHTVSEGVGMFTDIIVGLIEGGLGQEVVVTVSTQTGTAKGKFTLQQYFVSSNINSSATLMCKNWITSFIILIFTGGEDFDMITDHQLTFSPGVTFLPVPINITSDGDFEETENFLIILSVRDFALQLNAGTQGPINLRRNICQDKNFFSIDSRIDDNEPISIDLDRVFVSQAGNGISFNLAANESERVGVSPARASVTILDNDSKFHYLINIMMISYTSRILYELGLE